MLPFRGRVCVCVRMNKEKKKNDKKKTGRHADTDVLQSQTAKQNSDHTGLNRIILCNFQTYCRG